MLSKDKQLYLGVVFLLCAFLVLKVLRGFVVTVSSMEQGGIWNVIQMCFVLFGLMVFFSKDKSFKNYLCIRIYIAFMLYVWFLGLFPFLLSQKFDLYSIHRFVTIPYGASTLLLFYYIGNKSVDIKRYKIWFVVVFLVISLIEIIVLRLYWTDVNDENGAVADVYYVVGLLPLVVAFLPGVFKLFPFILACIAVMFSGKRGGFIMLAGVIFLVFLFGQSSKKRKGDFLVRMIVFFSVLLIIVFFIESLSNQYDLSMFDRLAKIQEDGGSGRADRWRHVLDKLWNDSSVFQFLFGHGYGSAVKLIGGHVHNDFLEFFYNYGFFAFFAFVFVFLSLFKEGLKMFRHHYLYAAEYMSSVFISLCLALFSFYAIDCTHITCCSVCFGLFLSDWNKFKQNGYARITE